ncbi:MAG: DUF115 domain-containing protein [Crenarchaeota archaeon]|nr:DUF115 domain-containing protein [Thermoproteota archaeon]
MSTSLSAPPWLLEVIDAARASLGYSVADDCFAAAELERLLWEAMLEGRLAGAGELCGMLRGRRVLVAGAASSLPADLEAAEGLRVDVVVAADGAAGPLLEFYGRVDIVVGDLDGGLSAVLRAAEEGAVVVVHAHGDNVPLIRLAVPMLERVAGTHQCPGRRSPAALPPIGFTDGDKAVALAVLCGAGEILLAGMDFDAPVGPWSKPWLEAATPPWPEKRRKLGIARRIVELLLAAHQPRRRSHPHIPAHAREPGSLEAARARPRG